MSAVADLATVARWCESGEEGRVEAWLEEEAVAREALYGVELLNEPAGFREDVWRRVRDDFYPDGYDRWGL